MDISAFVCPHPIQFQRERRKCNSPWHRKTLVVSSSIARRMADISNHPQSHPVLQILRDRLNTGSKPGRRKDDRKVALCIEGGGMRGAVSAGMAAAIKYVGLQDAFDSVYGCSAGAIVGAYFVSRQVPMYGAQIYYDTICSIPENGQRFIDLWALRHHPYLRMKREKRRQFYSEGARPVLLLDNLIDDVMRNERPLDWNAFWKMHAVQPLKPVASSLLEMRAHTLDSFSTFDEFLECLRASARVPGIAGNPVEINGDLYADGLMFEPIPYRSAVEDGCTDVLVLRTRTDANTFKNSKPGIYEKHIARPYFQRVPSLTRCSKASDYLLSGHHISLYQEDARRLQEENLCPGSLFDAPILSITLPPGSPEVGQLESRPRQVYQGVRNGFAAAYNTLSPFAIGKGEETEPEPVRRKKRKRNSSQRKDPGMQAAKWVFPDEEIVSVEARHKALKKKAGTRRRRSGKIKSAIEKKRTPRRLWGSRRRSKDSSGVSMKEGISANNLSVDEHYSAA